MRLESNRTKFSRTSSSFATTMTNTSNKIFLNLPYKSDKSANSEDGDKIDNCTIKNDGGSRSTPISFNNHSNDFLDSSLSPKSVESQTSCRSHDGVFLRPDAISNQSSPISNSNASNSSSSTSATPTMTALLSHRLTKRTSVDSGINMEQSTFRPSLARSKAQSREYQLMRLNRFDRSMSLPISNSSILAFNSSNSITTAASQIYSITAAAAAGIDSANDSFSLSLDSAIDPHGFYSNGSNASLNNTSLLSPTRRMDFALCEYSHTDCM